MRTWVVGVCLGALTGFTCSMVVFRYFGGLRYSVTGSIQFLTVFLPCLVNTLLAVYLHRERRSLISLAFIPSLWFIACWKAIDFAVIYLEVGLGTAL